MAAPNSQKIYTGVILDFETGGLDPKKNGITQVGMQAIRLDTFEIFAEEKMYIIPYQKVEVGPKKKTIRKKKKDVEEEEEESPLMEYDWGMSEKKIGISEDMCYQQGVPLEQAVATMIEFFKKAKLTNAKNTLPILIGQNICFDIGYLQQIFAFTKNKLKGLLAGSEGFYDWNIAYMDSLQLARLMFADDKKVTSYQLELVADRLGIELFDAHDALSDVEATGDVIRNLALRMRKADESEIKKKRKAKTRDHWSF